ncbi:MAG: sigma-70 family RNA polymerase sigma factor [Rhodanobacteraceae bacterium]
MSPRAPDEREELAHLLQQTGGDDRQAFAELYRRTSSRLFGVCVHMLRERGEAEDVLQNVYIAIWRRAERFDPARAAAMTWLITLARNQCIDRLRKHREVPLDEAKAARLTDPDPDPSAHSEASEERQRLERCLDTLAGQQKADVRAAFFSGATYNELAKRCGVPLATMKSRIRRSLIRLRGCLEHLTNS